MRQEALVYGFVAGCALGLRLLFATGVATVIARGAALSVGFVSAWLANAWIEATLIGATTRTDRSQGTFARFGEELGLRAEEAIVTLGGVAPSARPAYLVLAIITFGLLVELGRRASNGANVGPIAAACASIGLLLVMDVLVGGLGFVPGLAATTPVAVLGLSQVRFWPFLLGSIVGLAPWMALLTWGCLHVAERLQGDSIGGWMFALLAIAAGVWILRRRAARAEAAS